MKSRNITDMAAEMMDVLDPAKKEQQAGKAPKAKAKSKAKTKAAAKPAITISKCKQDSSVSTDKKKPPAFPGTERQKPIRWGSCTIYTSDSKWRVKVKPGDRLDIAKPFTENPKKGWKAVIDLCLDKGTFTK